MSDWSVHLLYDEAIGPWLARRRPVSDRFVYPVVELPTADVYDQGFDGPLLNGTDCGVCGQKVVWCYGKFGEWMHARSHREIEGTHLAQPGPVITRSGHKHRSLHRSP